MDVRDGSLPDILLRVSSDIHGKYLCVALPNVGQGTVLHAAGKLACNAARASAPHGKPPTREVRSVRHFLNYN